MQNILLERKLIKMGQIRVENLKPSFIMFIGFSEIFGFVGWVSPMSLNTFTFLAAFVAVGLLLHMPFAELFITIGENIKP